MRCGIRNLTRGIHDCEAPSAGNTWSLPNLLEPPRDYLGDVMPEKRRSPAHERPILFTNADDGTGQLFYGLIPGRLLITRLLQTWGPF